jgi:hypothetical protein
MSQYQQKYKNVKPIYHDRTSGLTTYERITPQQTCFDSTSEYRTYLLLCELFSGSDFHINVHPSIACGDIKWKIDFTVEARSGFASQLLASVANAVHGSKYGEIEVLGIEYKGFQDKGFLEKMDTFMRYAPNLTKTFVFLSSVTTGYCFYDDVRCSVLLRPVLKTSLFEQIVRGVLDAKKGEERNGF